MGLGDAEEGAGGRSRTSNIERATSNIEVKRGAEDSLFTKAVSA